MKTEKVVTVGAIGVAMVYIFEKYRELEMGRIRQSKGASINQKIIEENYHDWKGKTDLMQVYVDNEDWNKHMENRVMITELYGSPKDIQTIHKYAIAQFEKEHWDYNNAYEVSHKSWDQFNKEYGPYRDYEVMEGYEAESEGEKVRNRLQGSDVGPEDDMLSTPSIYRDWVRVQKGYQSLRMMNDNDNFNSEEAHFNIYEDSFSSEWHYFSECETKGCDGSIEYRDVYACPSCGQDDVEILMGDTCPDCGDIADDVSKYAIFYCSDCEEDYTDMYNSEDSDWPNCASCENPIPKDEYGKPDEVGDGSSRGSCCACVYCAGNMCSGDCEAKEVYYKWSAEVQTTSNKVRTISGKPLQLRKLTHDKDLKPEDAKYRLDISAEGMRTCSQCETPKHPLYRGSGSLMGARQICRECNMKAMEGSSSPSFLGNRMLFDAENHAQKDYKNIQKDLNRFIKTLCTCKHSKGAPSALNLTTSCGYCGEEIDEVSFYGLTKKAESFGATVYRGKPMSELGYVDRVMATKRMIESADIEQSILQLEAAIRMGLISEEDIMNQLRDKFGSE